MQQPRKTTVPVLIAKNCATPSDRPLPALPAPMAPPALLAPLVLTLLLCAGLAGAEAKPDLTGVWVLNADASQELVRKKTGGGGFGGLQTSVSVGGMGIPLPGGGQAASSSGGKLKDPDVLFCQQLEISVVDEVVVVHYQGLGEDQMKPGKHQGKKVRWTGSKLSERYETTSRKVSKEFRLTSPDQMKVTVKLNPRQGSTREFVKVFDRASPEVPQSAGADS
jgi:hypothetical protein